MDKCLKCFQQHEEKKIETKQTNKKQLKEDKLMKDCSIR